jgi:environmental stress-induced protein Ves
MDAPDFVLLDPGGYRRMPWKNGGGVTVDIAGEHRPGADPAGWDGMIWRFGRTRIERPGPFSDLSGYDRILAVVEGRGLLLRPEGRAPLDVREPFKPVRFPGEWTIASELTEGPVGVVNLIAGRTLCAIDLAFPAPGAAFFGARCVVLALDDAVLDIGATAKPLGRDFALRFDGDAPRRLILGSGRVAVASIRPRR